MKPDVNPAITLLVSSLATLFLVFAARAEDFFGTGIMVLRSEEEEAANYYALNC